MTDTRHQVLGDRAILACVKLINAIRRRNFRSEGESRGHVILQDQLHDVQLAVRKLIKLHRGDEKLDVPVRQKCRAKKLARMMRSR